MNEIDKNLEQELNEVCERIKNSEQYDIKELNKYLNSIITMVQEAKISNKIHLLFQEQAFVELLLKTVPITKAIVSPIDSKFRTLMPASLLLKIKEFAELYEMAHQPILEESYIFLQELHDNIDKDFINKRVIKFFFYDQDCLVDAGFSAVKSHEHLIFVNQEAKKAKDAFYTSMASKLAIVEKIMNYERSLFSKIDQITHTTLISIFDNSVAQFANSNGAVELQSLEKQVRRLTKNRIEKLSAEEWAKMMTVEEEAMRLAINGELVNSKDSDFVGYSSDIRKEMENNKQLMSLLLDIYNDKELFDFKRIAPLYKDVLRSDNLMLFNWLVYRANVMHSYMNTKLMKRLDNWLHPTNIVNDIQVGIKSPFTCKNEVQIEQDSTEIVEKTEDWLKENNKVLTVNRKKRLYTFQLLYDFIDKNFVKCCNHTYEWYALYRFLKDEGYCNSKYDVSKFAEQMNAWFSEASKKCSVSETNRYSVLNGYDVNEWSGLDEKKLDSRSKTNKKGIGNIHQVYMSMKKKHDVL